MTGRERVNAWLNEGRLLHPMEGAPSFVHLIRALTRVGGVQVPVEPETAALEGDIGDADHVIFVLVDGMGSDHVAGLQPNAFLKLHLAGELRSVFLSTTACALTTLATGEWPAVHAIPGWWTRLVEHDITATTLPFVERASRLALDELSVQPEDLFCSPSIWPQLTHELVTLLPTRIAKSVYSDYSMGGTLRTGYDDLRQAVTLILKRIQTAHGPTFTYLYVPDLDEAAHRLGPRHDEVRQALVSLDWLLDDMARVLAGRARVVVTSDHGIAELDESKRFILNETDPIRRHLVTRPTGEPAVPIFHVHGGHDAEFHAEFDERFGETFALLTPDDIEAMELMGPGKLTGAMRRRLGTFVGIAPEAAAFAIRPSHGAAVHKGVHGGLTPEEMRIPLVLA
jgi:predicted AlkP superfamily pyrophosphatase or phosphodiesterase